MQFITENSVGIPIGITFIYSYKYNTDIFYVISEYSHPQIYNMPSAN